MFSSSSDGFDECLMLPCGAACFLLARQYRADAGGPCDIKLQLVSHVFVVAVDNTNKRAFIVDPLKTIQACNVLNGRIE